MSKKAMNLALEALEAWEASSVTAYYKLKALDPVLRKAIADAEKQEQGEPVAWMLEQGPHVEFERMDYHDGAEWTPLYTTPQQRKPLSAYINSAKINATDLPHIVVEKLEKAIEAAHGIKE